MALAAEPVSSLKTAAQSGLVMGVGFVLAAAMTGAALGKLGRAPVTWITGAGLKEDLSSRPAVVTGVPVADGAPIIGDQMPTPWRLSRA